MKKTHPLEIVVVLLMIIVAYGYFYASPDWNTNSRLAMVRAVVADNSFQIDSYFRTGIPTRDVAKVRDHYYSDKAIGSSLVGLVFYFPLYAIGQITGNQMGFPAFRELMTFLVASLLSAFVAPFIYSFAKKVSNHAGMALLVTAIICVGTPFYKYSTAYYGHTLAGLFLFTAFFIWFNIKDDEKINPVKVLISGYFLSFSFITEYPTAVIAFFLGLYILYILWQKGSLFNLKIYVRLMIGAAIPVILVLAYNMAVFHHPFKTGYGYELVKTFAEGQSGGLMGIGLPNLNTLFYMTFHTTMGIFWQSPVLLMSFWGWIKMWKDGRYRPEAILSFVIILVYFLMMSGYYMWWGGGAFTPRSLIPVFPFFAIPMIFLVRKLEKVLLIILAIPSIIQMFMVTVANSFGMQDITDMMLKTSIATMFRQDSIMYNVFVFNFFRGQFVVNRGSEFLGLTGYASLIPFLLIEVALLAAFVVVVKRNAAASKIEIQDI